MSATWTLALSGARAHRRSLVGTALVLALAGSLLSLTGVLMESGLRAQAPSSAVVDGGMLVALASSFSGTALVVVVLVVASTVALVLRGRRPEFAMLRAVGATRRQVRSSISAEVLLVTLAVAPIGAVIGLGLVRFLTPTLVHAGLVGEAFAPALSPLPALGATTVLVPTALVAGRLAARETVRTSPTAAVRESAVEAATIGRGRRITALVTGVAGLVVACTPLVVPGTLGSVTAATSAFLLIGAAALAGPLLVGRAFAQVTALHSPRRSGPTRLALGNVRGFSRRLTTVVVPLALILGTGTIQTGVNQAVERAATQQLAASMGADLVVSADGALSPEQVEQVAAIAGVSGVAPVSHVSAQVRTDEEELPLADALVWEPTPLRVIDPDAAATTFDPGVVEGSLADLHRPDTVAISTDAAFELRVGLGDRIDVRYGEGEQSASVVATYDRGLGVGGFLVGPATVAAHDLTATTEAILVAAEGAGAATVAQDIRALGLTATDRQSYLDTAINADAASQRVSTVLLLLLLLFVGLGAANTLVLTTAGRREELVLLHRTGTTRRQLRRMILIESLLTGGVAWVIGTLAVVPAVLGVSIGLLGFATPALHLPTYALLSVGVVVLAVAATAVTGARTVRSATHRVV